MPLALRCYEQVRKAEDQAVAGDQVSTYYVEILLLETDRTDFITGSRYQASCRRDVLQARGHLAQVRKGSRVVIDVMGVSRP